LLLKIPNHRKKSVAVAIDSLGKSDEKLGKKMPYILKNGLDNYIP